MNKEHREALEMLGFVQRRLAHDDERRGTHFVPRAEVTWLRPKLLAVVEETETRLSAVVRDGTFTAVTFTANTPKAVVNQAAAAMMKEVGW